ncbi:MAG TPA: ribosome-binding factor A [Candidatus Pacearchaeota archaeon]|nr:ribosome-binding factor A [Candidatus Pacearchaeota archaeon]HPM08771.1 ribosome-binding factor A [Candidatus Pacearchaeota archaeon]
MSFRNKRIEELLKKEVGNSIIKRLSFPKDILITISGVDLHSKGYIADIFVSVIPDSRQKESLAILVKNVYDIQQDINKRLKIKPVPKIIFRCDIETKEMIHLEETFKKIEEDLAR